MNLLYKIYLPFGIICETMGKRSDDFKFRASAQLAPPPLWGAKLTPVSVVSEVSVSALTKTADPTFSIYYSLAMCTKILIFALCRYTCGV